MMGEHNFQDDYIQRYLRRVNRLGSNPQDRLEMRRRQNFDRFKAGSPHYVKIKLGRKTFDGVLEPFKLRENRKFLHLLVNADVVFNTGDVLLIRSDSYLVLSFDHRRNSGYNRFVVAELTHNVKWDPKKDNTEKVYYHYPIEMVLDNVNFGRPTTTVYEENIKKSFIVAPDREVNIDDYIEVFASNGKSKFYTIAGVNRIAIPGVAYITLSNTIKRDLTDPPEYIPPEGEQAPDPDDVPPLPDDFFWFGGGD